MNPFFDFIFVAGSNAEPMDEYVDWRRETGAVVLIKGGKTGLIFSSRKKDSMAFN